MLIPLAEQTGKKYVIFNFTHITLIQNKQYNPFILLLGRPEGFLIILPYTDF